eukprot:7724925-Lingulodinium_polyedra.AAC.1
MCRAPCATKFAGGEFCTARLHPRKVTRRRVVGHRHDHERDALVCGTCVVESGAAVFIIGNVHAKDDHGPSRFTGN